MLGLGLAPPIQVQNLPMLRVLPVELRDPRTQGTGLRAHGFHAQLGKALIGLCSLPVREGTPLRVRHGERLGSIKHHWLRQRRLDRLCGETRRTRPTAEVVCASIPLVALRLLPESIQGGAAATLGAGTLANSFTHVLAEQRRERQKCRPNSPKIIDTKLVRCARCRPTRTLPILRP